MILVIGGESQGKKEYAANTFGLAAEEFADGASCTEQNPDILVVSNELGYGVVPVDKFERLSREKTGRICCALAAFAKRVDRVVCGIGMVIKNE